MDIRKGTEMPRSYDKLLEAIETAGEPDTCPVNAQRMIQLANAELKRNELGFSPAQIRQLNAAIEQSVSAAGARFIEKCA